jgi:acetyltransferase-like isoleucine patch superfamily enzyme
MKEDDLDELVVRAREIYRELENRTRTRWNRSLPLEELLFDRWQRARSLGFGEDASIYHDAYVYGDVRVGRKTWIGPHTLLDGSGGGIEIGEFCSISAGVQIYTHDTVAWALTGGEAAYEKAPVKIGDRSYIGAKSVIAKGVTIGDHSVVGACSFVNRDVPPYTVVAGVPARAIGQVRIQDGQVTMVYA